MLTRNARSGAMIVAAASFCSPLAAGDETNYRIVKIPAPHGTIYYGANDFNDSNQATGTALGDQRNLVFLYSDGESTIIDNVPGTRSTALSINDAGHVAGWMYEWGVIWPEAYLWNGDACLPLGTYTGRYSYGHALNDRDQVVGYWYGNGAQANGNAFIHDGRRMFDLGGGQADDVNNAGIVVGEDDRGFGDAAVWEPNGNGWTKTVLDGAMAHAVNEAGTIIVGTGPSVSYLETPVMWTRDGDQWVRTDIGNFDPFEETASAVDVNNAGQIVGNHQRFGEAPQGFLYQQGEITWLDDQLTSEFANWHVTRTIAINESGHILATAEHNGTDYSVILVPDELSILGPRPGVAGESNELMVTGATPNEHVFFIYGAARGNLTLPGCPGVDLGVRKPQIIGSASANDNGDVRISRFVPDSASGRTIYLQAVEPGTCTVSNVLPYQFR